MKKTILIILTLLVCLILSHKAFDKRNNVLSGQITYSAYDDNSHGSFVMEMETRQQRFIKEHNNVKFLNDGKMISVKYDSVEMLDSNGNTERIYDFGEVIDYATMINDSRISLSCGKSIFQLNLISGEKTVVVDDNGSKYHDWLSEKLIYSNVNDEITEYDMSSGFSQKICGGREPIVSGNNQIIAYKTLKGNLKVLDIQTSEQHVYNGNAYYYCFSPKSNLLLIEDEMKFFTAISGALFDKQFVGHRIVAWDFKTNRISEVINRCFSGAGEGFSWQTVLE